MTSDPLRRFPLVFALVALFCVGPVACKSLYVGTVTLTKTVEAAARDYARIYNDGLVPPDLHTKVSAAHLQYRIAAGVAADALEAVKAGKTADTKAALEAARVAANSFVDLLLGLLPKPRVVELKAQIQKAQSP
jgi:hypothetical protein